MTDATLAAYHVDVDNRLTERRETTVSLVNAHQIDAGVVYKDARVTISAFRVAHGDLEASGYRFETPDRAIVISGDTSPTNGTRGNGSAGTILTSTDSASPDSISKRAPSTHREISCQDGVEETQSSSSARPRAVPGS
jgi:hypothetical protein